MQRRYKETRYNQDTKKIEIVADWIFSIYPGDNTIITFCKNGICKTIKVKESFEYTYKLRKSYIEAIGGAAGLYKFLDDKLYNDCGSAFAFRILNYYFN